MPSSGNVATRICIFLDSDAISKYNGRNELGTRRDEVKLAKETDGQRGRIQSRYIKGEV